MADSPEKPDFTRPVDFADPVVIYTTPWCGFCVAARRLLTERAIPFAAVDVRGNAQARAWLSEATGQTTVPQVFIHGESIGGYTELAGLDRSGDLLARVRA